MYGTLGVVKENVYMCVCCLLQAKIFSGHLYVTLEHGQATKEFLVNLPKVPTLFPTFSALFKLPQHLKRLKALLKLERNALIKALNYET